MALNIVLFEPEIPNNTGNIGRLSLATGSKLHLVKPFGFEIDDARLRRAGLDYWKHVQVFIYDSIDEFYVKNHEQNMVYLSSHAKHTHWSIEYKENMFLVFGKESVGLPKSILRDNPDTTYKIPMHSEEVRSLNLSNAVSIVVYEGLRNLR